MKTKDNPSEKSRPGKRHPIRQKLLSVLLCACLSLVSLPMEFYGSEVRAEELQKQILSFSDLPQEIKYQALEPGMPLENLNLPETLEAACIPLGNEPAVNSEFSAQLAGEAEMQEAAEMQGAVEALEPGIDIGTEQTVIIENITWLSVPSHDPEAEGTYVFTPVLPGRYVLAEGVPLPEIQVTVKSAEGSQGEGEGRELSALGKRDRSEAEEMEESGKRPGNRESLISPASEEHDGEPGELESLVAPASEDIVIDKDTAWDRRTLSNQNLVIEEGATLTLNGSLDITGNVTIRGKGTIVRGKSDARINVSRGVALTMQGITVDGNGWKASYAMIFVNGGILKLEAGCKIQNCHTRAPSVASSMAGYGGAVYLAWNSGAKAELLDCIISGCTASAGGAAYCSEDCTLTLDKGCRIENCQAVKEIPGKDPIGLGEGGAIAAHLYEATVKLLDCTISNCSAENSGGALHCNSVNLTLGKSCKIENCSAETYGGAVVLWDVKVDFQGCTISNCSVKGNGGAIYCGASPLTINGDCMIQQCKAGKGGAIYNESSKLHINGGVISGNTATNAGGAIFHSNTNGTETYLSGGTFQGNSCTSENYAGSGGACLSSEGTAAYETHFEMSGDVKFCGDGMKSGVDGIYLDSQNAKPRKIILSENLKEPVTVYLAAAEHYVIAKGTENYHLTEDDKKKISFVDVGTSGKRWGLRLDEDENEIYLTETTYKTFSADFYSGGPEPSEPVCEEREVETFVSEEDIKVPALRDFPNWTQLGWNESASKYTVGIDPDGTCTLTEEAKKYYGIYQREVTLSYDVGEEGQGPDSESKTCYANVHEGEIGYQKAEFMIGEGPDKENYDFLGWSSQEGGQSPLYRPGNTLEIMDDTVLYAVYQEKGTRIFLADFYSGNPVQIRTEMAEEEETATEGIITAPSLADFPGWEPLGWSASKMGHEAVLLPQGTCTLREDRTEYYGIYRKNITLTYDSNGGESLPDSETKPGYANVHQEVMQEFPEFTFAPAIRREGYAFVGWSTSPDGSGTLYEAEATETLEQDMVLYAAWQEVSAEASYRVEHYCQNLTGEDYTRMDNDTENLTGTVGAEVEAQPKTYLGFTVNLSQPYGKPRGNVEADGSLVLKLYYDRNIYEVDFDLNGGAGAAPAPQKIRYGDFLEKVSDPLRAGYNFKGWRLEKEGLAGDLWDFDSPVENNTGETHTTLYAGWADELAPALEKAAFSNGHRNFLDWILQKQTLDITVPVTEEGSGLAKAEYLLMSEDGTEKDGEAQFQETYALAPYGTSAVVLRGIQKQAERGKYEVRFAIEEEFKGKVYLTCTDHAGNISAQKTLTVAGGGVIVEDNAPEIYFSNTNETSGGKMLEVKVTVKDNMEGHVTGGISRIRYVVDDKEKKSLPKEDFAEDFVEEYDFMVKIKGEGKHTLRVETGDHAGNENAAEITLKINGKRDVPVEVPDSQAPDSPRKPSRPLGGEPKTGEILKVQVYATTAMIAGFGYLLLYFQGENGITEQEKEEIIYRLVSWAKQGGSIRRLLGLAVIFVFLAYYHSIGKSVNVEWKEVHGK